MRAKVRNLILALALIAVVAVGTTYVFAESCCINCYGCIICQHGCEDCTTDLNSCSIFGVGCSGSTFDCIE